jgi:hypothetical protein
MVFAAGWFFLQHIRLQKLQPSLAVAHEANWLPRIWKKRDKVLRKDSQSTARSV